VLSVEQGWADSWHNEVSSQLSAEYETNPAMTPTSLGSIRRVVFGPSYTLIGQVGTNELKAGLAVSIYRSSNHVLSPNREDPSVFFDWTHHSETSEFGISPRYSETATSDSGIDATQPVPVSSIRASRSLTGRWNKELNERSSLSADGSFDAVTYRGSGNYIDYSTRTGNLRLSHDVSEKSKGYLRLSGQKYVPIGTASSTRLASATFGLNWKISDYLEGSLEIGKTKSSGVKTATNGSASIQYAGPLSQLILEADRQVSPSGLGGFVKADHLGGNWNYSLSERSNMGIDLEWWKNLSTNIYNIRTSTGVWLQHNFSPLWAGRMKYQEYMLTGGGVVSISSNVIGVSLAYINSDF